MRRLPVQVLLLAFVTCACSGDSPTIPEGTTLQVQLTASVLLRHEATQATATVRDASGQVVPGVPVTWESSDTTIARVTSAGVVTAMAPGSATITARAATLSGNAPLNVTELPAPEPASGAVTLWQDSFDSGVFDNYSKRGVQQAVSGRTGSAVRFPYTASSYDNLLEFTFPETQDIYVRYWYRVSPGGDPTCHDQGAPGMKWLMLWRADGLPRYTMGVGSLGDDNIGAEFTTHDNSSTRQPNPFVQNVVKTPRFVTTNDGNWHRYSLHVVTGAAGYEQVWIDGVLVLDDQAQGYDHVANGIQMIQFPGTVVTWFDGCDFTLDVDDLVVWHK